MSSITKNLGLFKYDTETDAKQVFDLNVALNNNWDILDEKCVGGLEILDIGIAPCGINETENKRRYLNGQLITQEQFPAFTTKLKQRIGWNSETKTASLLPNLVKIETEWQTTKASSDFGQVGAFVIDDDAGTIRLPAVVNIQGLFDLQNAGLTVGAGLPNIKSTIEKCFRDAALYNAGNFGAIKITENGSTTGLRIESTARVYDFDLDASRSNSIYGNSNTVQQEAIQYPYFIQVATGAEYEEPVIHEYTVTSAYSYGMSQYYPGIMNNNAWLRSNGQWNSGAVYVGLYEWILANVNSGVEGFKGVGYAYTSGDDTYYISTVTPTAGATVYGDSNGICLSITTVTTISENSISFTNGSDSVTATRSSTDDKAITDDYWITDYDYVINTTNETFRLPLLDGSEDLVGDDAKILSTDYPSLSLLTLEKNGTLAARVGGQYLSLTNISNKVEVRFPSDAYSSGGSSIGAIDGKRGDVIRIRYVGKLSGFTFAPFKGNGNLYYYCGNVEQNTQLVNVARIEETLVDIIPKNKELITSYSAPSDRYDDLELQPSDAKYTAPEDGYFTLNKGSNANYQYILFIKLVNGVEEWIIKDMSVSMQSCSLSSLFMKKGDTLQIKYTASGNTQYFRFIYAEGVK